jgi:hypothetical protein
MPQTLTGSTVSGNENDVFLLYHGRSHVTGQRLGDFLGVPHGRETGPRADYLIRWGSRTGAGWRPRETVINSRASLNNNSDKLDAMRQLENAGIPVPPYTEDRDDFGDEIDYPLVGREEQHSRGEDINLILQWRDAYLTENDFFVKYIPTDLEYRMHVVNGDVVQIHEKRLRSEADNHPFIRNAETGWVFVEPRETPPPDQLAIDAVGALGLDFGAVDVIREEDTGDHYVLEVNTAPSLDEANLRRYGEAFAEATGIETYPGLDAVDFDEDDDGGDESPDEERAADDESGFTMDSLSITG